MYCSSDLALGMEKLRLRRKTPIQRRKDRNKTNDQLRWGLGFSPFHAESMEIVPGSLSEKGRFPTVGSTFSWDGVLDRGKGKADELQHLSWCPVISTALCPVLPLPRLPCHVPRPLPCTLSLLSGCSLSPSTCEPKSTLLLSFFLLGV